MMIQVCSWCFAPVGPVELKEDIMFVFCCQHCQDEFIRAAQKCLEEEQDETDY